MSEPHTDVQERYCIVCGEASRNSICQHCEAKIRGEAANRKQHIDKEGRIDTSRK